MKFSNIWKGWLTTLLGVLITVLTAIGSQLLTGTISWNAVLTAAIPSIALALTDLQKLLTKQTTGKPAPRAYKGTKKP